jgi:uncharacterized protein CbrC (UPF0167 family)
MTEDEKNALLERLLNGERIEDPDRTPFIPDPENSTLRKKEERIVTKRTCKKCGAMFYLGVQYDSKNPAHDLCDDCILDSPAENQKYAEKTNQALLLADGPIECDGDNVD